MEHITEAIRSRRSFRSYDGRPLSEGDMDKLRGFAKTAQNPFGLPVEFRFLNAKEHGLICPVVSGADLFVAGKIKNGSGAGVAFGYSFETFVLYAQSLGIGTVWLGGTMNRAAFEKAMELADDEIMPCVSPLGYPAKRMSLRETMMRGAVKADERLPFEKLFFDGAFAKPLVKEKAGDFALPLEMVRLSPSAVNKQPWRVVVTDGTAHFYLKRSKGFHPDGRLDMQMVDMGIALCHFALTAGEMGLEPVFSQQDPGLAAEADAEYIASYTLR